MSRSSTPSIAGAGAVPDRALSLDRPAGRPIPQDPEALLFTAEAAYLLAVSPRSMDTWRVRGGGCPYVVVGRAAVRYRRQDVIAFRDAGLRRSTSDPGPLPIGSDARGLAR